MINFFMFNLIGVLKKTVHEKNREEKNREKIYCVWNIQYKNVMTSLVYMIIYDIYKYSLSYFISKL